MDKLQLNNTLLTHKKTVQKAKTVIINKLVQKIRKLKAFSEKKPDDVNVKGKILRTTEIIAAIKQLKQVETLKKALVVDKNLLAVITNGRSLPEEIAEALLFTSKPIIKIVNDIKKEFKLDGTTNPDWKEKILELSKKQLLQLKTKRKQEMRKQRNELNAMKTKRTEWLEENLPEHIKDNINEMEILTETEIKSELNIPNSKKVKDKTLKLPSKKVLTFNDVEDIDEEDIDDEDKTEMEVDSSECSSQPENEVEPEMQEEVEYEEYEDNDEDEDEDDEDEVQKSVDPFFITASGANYLATAVVERYQPDGPDDGLVRKERRANQSGYNRKYQYSNGKFSNQRNVYTKNKEIPAVPIWKNVTNQRTQDLTENTEQVHPSWAAKQKQSGIKEFVGKKITFDGVERRETRLSDQSHNTETKMHPSWEAKQKQKGIKEFAGKKISFDSNANIESQIVDNFKSITTNDDKLHPSWMAKQKQKGIKEFGGKKIVFDDHENKMNLPDPSWKAKPKNHESMHFIGKKSHFDAKKDNPTKINATPSDEKLHPSWVAKQKLKPVISEFKGQKIVFDDN